MHNRMKNQKPTRAEVLIATAKFLKETPGDIRAKIAFLLEEGMSVPDLIQAIKLAANAPIIVAMIEAREIPKQNWRMN